MDEEVEQPRDLLLSETVDDLREVFLVDHVFPTEWEPDEKVEKRGFAKSCGDWFRRVLGLRKASVPDVTEDADERCG